MKDILKQHYVSKTFNFQTFKINFIIKMSATLDMILECPICMDDINVNKNCITTECGHCFHASCVMRNVAQNGFACPMCRTAMAEESEDEEYSVISGDDSVVDPNPSDYALRGFRLFMDNVEGAEHDHEDVLEEAEDNEEAAKPSVAHITQQLTANGVTMEDLVKILLRDHEEYEDEDEEYDEVDERVWGQMRTIISNYEESRVEPEAEALEEVVTPVAPAQAVALEEPIHPNVTVRRPKRRTGIVENLNSVARELDNEW